MSENKTLKLNDVIAIPIRLVMRVCHSPFKAESPEVKRLLSNMKQLQISIEDCSHEFSSYIRELFPGFYPAMIVIKAKPTCLTMFAWVKDEVPTDRASLELFWIALSKACRLEGVVTRGDLDRPFRVSLKRLCR